MDYFADLGVKGGLILGMTVAELFASYWNSRHNSTPPPKVYILNRRIHHGELGALLALSSLFLRMSSVPSGTIGIFAGVGFGLLKDDIADIREWFKLRKEKEDQGQTSLNTTFPIHEEPEILTQTFHESKNGNRSEKVLSGNSPRGTENQKDEQINNISPIIRKKIRSLIEAQSEMLNEIQSQINESRRHLLLSRKSLC